MKFSQKPQIHLAKAEIKSSSRKKCEDSFKTNNKENPRF